MCPATVGRDRSAELALFVLVTCVGWEGPLKLMDMRTWCDNHRGQGEMGDKYLSC